MASKKKRRERMDAWATVRNVKLGWHGKKGGKPIIIWFYGKDGSKVGELGISAATLYWQGNKRKTWAEIPTGDLERLFRSYY
jgi:hypothetical protein